MNKDRTDIDRRQFLTGAAVTAGALTAAGRVLAAAPAATAKSWSAPLAEVAGKTAFITGGSSGIGLGQAHVFHEAIMASVHPEKPPADRVAMEVVNLRNPLYPAERDRLLARRRSRT